MSYDVSLFILTTLKTALLKETYLECTTNNYLNQFLKSANKMFSMCSVQICTGCMCTGTGEEDVQDASSAIIATCFPVWISPHLLPLLGPGCRRIESAETDNCSPPAAAGHHTARVLSIVSRSSHHPDSDTDTDTL